MLCIQWLRLGYYVTMIGNVMKSDVLLSFLGAWSQKEFGFRFAIADAYALLGSGSLFALRYHFAFGGIKGIAKGSENAVTLPDQLRSCPWPGHDHR